MSMSKKKVTTKMKRAKQEEQTDLMEQFSPLKVRRILPTNMKKKVDIFNSLKPKPEERLNYNISETFVKLDAGDTKINIKKTNAIYTPASVCTVKPKKTRKGKYFHGGQAQWKFVDEIWLEKQNLLQEEHKKQLITYIKCRRRNLKKSGRTIHKRILSMVGPDWFQELSPKQLLTVDQLKDCILKDIKDNTINNTQENVGNLGLVLRPNQKHIKLSLKLCCKSPVEFLLILYQLTNPNRKNYSLNDRLLLSAVVHLTMKETLRELHIRIPSPPNYREISEKSYVKQKKKTYDSPYLKPFSFKPDSPKFTGIYEKKHIQYPVSEYFSYIENLNFEKNLMDEDIFAVDLSILGEEDREVIEDLKQAQIAYNKLQKESKTKLLRPTILTSCNNFDTYCNEKSVKKVSELLLPSLAKIDESDEECECTESEEDTDICCDYNFSKPCECKEKCECRSKSKVFISSKCKKCLAKKKRKTAKQIITGCKTTVSANTVPIIGGTVLQKSCDCLKKYKDSIHLVTARNRIQCQKAKFVIGGVFLSATGPAYVITNAFLRNKNHFQHISSVHDEIETEKFVQNKCNISKVKKYDVKNDENEENNDKELDLKNNQIYNNVESENDDENNSCRCREELNKFLNNKCFCEQCNILKRNLNATYIMTGMRNMQGGNVIKIIEGVQEQQCNCLEKYKEKIEKLEEYKKRITARYRLKSQNIKYRIEGVIQTKTGPVYIISGIRPPVECECSRLLREKQEEELYLNYRAKLPSTGRIKYHITGTRQTPEGNVYIISQALAIEDCKCMKLFDTFKQAHHLCLESFKQYSKQTQEELDSNIDRKCSENILDLAVEKYLSKLEDDTEESFNSVSCINVYDGDKNEAVIAVVRNDIETNKRKSISRFLKKELYIADSTSGTTCINDENKPKSILEDIDRITCKNNDENKSANSLLDKVFCVPQTSVTKQDEENASSVGRCISECEYGKKSESEDISTDIAVTLTPVFNTCLTLTNDLDNNTNQPCELKRFVILQKIPSKEREQRKILKKVLASMAKDGYSLAKLPDCHKLPHLKLWMQLRCGKYWTQKDRVSYENLSKMYWAHTDYCYKEISLPQLGISKEVANEFTWKDAKRCRKLVSEKTEMFYRKVKQETIETAREFFPSTFSYEFPTITFRDCYFAYLPGKEEDVMAYHLVKY